MKLSTLIFWVLLITAGVMTCSGCIFVAGTHKHSDEDHPCCPVCDESYASDEHLDAHCATNFEGVEAKFGSHDFFLEGEDKITSSKLATKCLTCGIYFTYPDYGEHIKTCCP